MKVKKTIVYILIMFLVLISIVEIQFEMIDISENHDLSSFSITENFRTQTISKDNIQLLMDASKKENISFDELLAVSMAKNNYLLDEKRLSGIDAKIFAKNVRKYKKYKISGFDNLCNYYRMIWDDLEYFPVAESKLNKKATVSFDNSWLLERNYGGNRGHEGTDIMADINQRGIYPILSITDGEVVNIGWLELGGYRLGIKSESGAYLYYAHLYGYAPDLKEGDKVEAGELLGYMGDTGYSKVEGTTGNFDVHLHLGVYIYDEEGNEISVNPYFILKYLEDKKLIYEF